MSENSTVTLGSLMKELKARGITEDDRRPVVIRVFTTEGDDRWDLSWEPDDLSDLIPMPHSPAAFVLVSIGSQFVQEETDIWHDADHRAS